MSKKEKPKQSKEVSHKEVDHVRAETGALQFGNDWPGCWIRGDNAMYFGMVLNMFLDGQINLTDDVIYTSVLRGLAGTLSNCNANGAKDLQLLKDFSKCQVRKK